MPTDVRDDAAASRFVLAVDGLEAELVYKKEAGQLILIHTEVPDTLSGRGIGSRLIRAAIAHAKADHLTIVPWCPFARRWLAQHPGDIEGVSIGWDTLPQAGSSP